MLPPIVVHGLPPFEEIRSAALSSCSSVLGQRACVADTDLNASLPGPTTIAFVTWVDGASRRVHVVLERHAGGEIATLQRDVRFADDDPPPERARAMGLVIAALAIESERGAAPRAGDPSGSDAARTDAYENWIGVGALVGPGLNRGGPRFGALVAAGIGVGAPFFLAASASYAVRPVDSEGLSVRWITLGAGVGASAVLRQADLAVRARLELNLQYIAARLDASTVGAALQGDRVVPGVSLGVWGAWPQSSRFSLLAGAAISSFAGGTAIRLDQQNLGSSTWLGYVGSLGVAWSWR